MCEHAFQVFQKIGNYSRLKSQFRKKGVRTKDLVDDLKKMTRDSVRKAANLVLARKELIRKVYRKKNA